MKILILSLLFLSQLASAQVTTTSVAEVITQNKTISGVDINALDEHGKTLLHTAAARDDKTKLAKRLVEDGTDVNALDKNSQTPLHIAAFFSNLRMIKFLLRHKADINIKDKFGRTALDLVKLKLVNNEIDKERQDDIIELFINQVFVVEQNLIEAEELRAEELRVEELKELRKQKIIEQKAIKLKKHEAREQKKLNRVKAVELKALRAIERKAIQAKKPKPKRLKPKENLELRISQTSCKDTF